MAGRSVSARRLRVRALTCAAAAAGALLLAGAAPRGVEAPPFEITVGAPAGKKEPGPDLEVFVGEQRLEAVERLAPAGAGPLRVVVYIDYPSSRPVSVQELATALVLQSERLAAMPGLEIVEADPDPRAMPRWRTREELEQSVSRLALRAGDDEIGALRGEFLAGLTALSLGRPVGGGSSGDAATEAPDDGAADGSALDGDTPQALAEAAYRFEIERRRERNDVLLDWVAAQGRSVERRLLVLLNDNLGLDSAEFYRSHTPGAKPALQASAAPALDALAATIAAYGWTLQPIALDARDGDRRLRYAPNAQTPVGFRLGLGRKRDDAGQPVVDLGLEARDDDAVEAAARRTGGERLGDLETLADSITAFGTRAVLRFHAPEVPAGETRPLSIRSHGAAAVLAPDLVARGTPAEIAALRARRAVGGETIEGGLQVRSAIEFDPDLVDDEASRYEARVDLADLRRRHQDLERASFRVTLGVHVEDGEVLIKHDVVRDVALRGADEWLHEGSLRLPSSTDGAVVLVELLETGDWGESFAAFVRRRPGAPATAAGGIGAREIVPGARMVRLVPPQRGVVYGKSRIGAEVDPRVHRVVYLLDGKRVATRRGQPWDVQLDLGSDPRQRMVVAIAYGAGDVELGRDGLLLNDAARGFAVRIVEPRTGSRVGPVDVEAALDLPEGATLDRLEFYWQDQLVATVRRPPYRQRLFIPVVARAGFVRVAAHLADGRMAEDVVLMNADRFEEQVTVNLVELYVVVTDRSGKPVRDLDASTSPCSRRARRRRSRPSRAPATSRSPSASLSIPRSACSSRCPRSSRPPPSSSTA
jgi:hypothetical protein